ncbi:hypothetical protein [Hwanghaeella sp. LZ110]|uniref:hypothetical protein n=1 Tax=Hwanghaeella sp. LZ110 TaxID=3402810 RepID=UPI003B680673
MRKWILASSAVLAIAIGASVAYFANNPRDMKRLQARFEASLGIVDPLVQRCIDKIRPTLQRRESFELLEGHRYMFDGEESIEALFQAQLLEGGEPLEGVVFCSFNPLGGDEYELMSAKIAGDAYAVVRRTPAFDFSDQFGVVTILKHPRFDSLNK